MALISCLCCKCSDSVKYHSKFVPVFSLSLFLINLLDSSIPSINIVAKSFVAGSEGCMLYACSKRSVKFEIYSCMGLPFCLRSANLFWAAAELLQSEYLSLSLNFILSHSNPVAVVPEDIYELIPLRFVLLLPTVCTHFVS